MTSKAVVLVSLLVVSLVLFSSKGAQADEVVDTNQDAAIRPQGSSASQCCGCPTRSCAICCFRRVANKKDK
ncbi:hypothetical protein QJS04_geneDACA017116 [Acorus gramineus]|uniref:Uncharacterized protein n=1 Tax=Acorus gramineus TaxID=55184 RepID=A0AAV9AWD3_ACOGR|nr:hypothetical protein QJS04_geneDACA017116 [Acorus gramineus]